MGADVVRQSDLAGDAAALASYGEMHPDCWTGLRYDGNRLIGYFVDPEQHASDVRELVAHPGSVTLQPAPFTRQYLDVVHDQATALLERTPGSWTRSSPGLLEVVIAFRGGFEHPAHELHERFGAAIQLTVGAFAYPLSLDAAASLRPAPTSTCTFDEVTITVMPDSTQVEQGHAFRGHVRITNDAPDQTFTLHTDQPVEGYLLNTDHDIVGCSTGMSMGTGRFVSLEAGQSGTIDFTAGTESLDPNLGTVLPPGHYVLVIEIPVYRDADTAAFITTPISVWISSP